MKLTILCITQIDELPSACATGQLRQPADFERQIDALLGWDTTHPSNLWVDYLNGLKPPLPARPFIITFDERYTCFDEHAWPYAGARAACGHGLLVPIRSAEPICGIVTRCVSR